MAACPGVVGQRADRTGHWAAPPPGVPAASIESTAATRHAIGWAPPPSPARRRRPPRQVRRAACLTDRTERAELPLRRRFGPHDRRNAHRGTAPRRAATMTYSAATSPVPVMITSTVPVASVQLGWAGSHTVISPPAPEVTPMRTSVAPTTPGRQPAPTGTRICRIATLRPRTFMRWPG